MFFLFRNQIWIFIKRFAFQNKNLSKTYVFINFIEYYFCVLSNTLILTVCLNSIKHFYQQFTSSNEVVVRFSQEISEGKDLSETYHRDWDILTHPEEINLIWVKNRTVDLTDV